MYGVSLFSGAGIGDVGWRAAGIETVALCEIEHDRAGLAAQNFPDARLFASDIHQVRDALVASVRERLREVNDELFLISCTAPCQGMSKNGQGTLLRNAREGRRPTMDPRNRLILPALDIIRALRPRWAVFENVPEMRNTLIEDETGEMRPILDVVSRALTPEYAGAAYVVEFADYGVPQRRQRLITVYTRDEAAKELFKAGTPLVPPTSHAQKPGMAHQPWVPVSEALHDFPALDAGDAARARSPFSSFHRVPVLEAKKYEWVRHTPPGSSAFDNQCINPSCLFGGNPAHGNGRGSDGINRALRTTPLYCQACGALLPRPSVASADGSLRLMSGFTSAYKRMSADLPAPTLTRNLSYPCSDQKIHPTENRVLSLAEAMRLQTISDYPYEWERLDAKTGKMRPVSDGLIRLVIGESVPPKFTEALGRHLIGLSGAGGRRV